MSSNRNLGGLKRLIYAFKYSVEGFIAATRSEEAFRQELFLFVLLIPAALLFDVGCVERVLLVSSSVLVIITELINSAIEAIVDRISEKKHPLSKKAKDIGSAVVFFAFINLVIVWSCILLEMKA